MAFTQNIFLIGPMGAGKSTVGRYLAKQLDVDFFDTDEEIENRTGVEIGWIFDVEGEMGFRKRETAVIKELVNRSPIVLATGGGSVIEPENRALLKAHGMIIYLEVSLHHQQDRTVNEIRRPLLRVENREDVLKKLAHERAPFYEEIADFRVLTDERTVQAVAGDILRMLKS